MRGLYDQPADDATGYLDDLIGSVLEPTEAMNSLIKIITRIGFGFRRFRNYRLRVMP